MQLKLLLISAVFLGFSALGWTAPQPRQIPTIPATRLDCDFESRAQQEWIECRAVVKTCAIDRVTGLSTATCINSVDVDCSNAFEFAADRSVKVNLRGDDLEIFAWDRSAKVRIEVEKFSASGTTFDSSLKIISRYGTVRLYGECKPTGSVVPTGSCQPSSSLSVLVTGTNAISYVPKGSWTGSATGIAAVNVEGTSITNTLIPTTSVVNSCASNSVTGQTVCTANNSDVYLLSGTTLNNTLTSAGTGTIGFSGGSCTNCGVAMDATHNKALIGLSLGGTAGFQFLNLAGIPAFETAFPSGNSQISEDPLIDPIRNFILSPSEDGNYEIVNVATTTSPAFFENATGGGTLDSAGEDCSTGIALAPAEFSDPSNVFIADLTQATFTPGTGGAPGTWSAPSQVQTLSESSLSAGASGIAVAQGTHLGVVTGEFGGNALTAIALPATSGTGTPAITDWVTCGISGFSMGLDPHTVTAYQSPNSGNAIALLANGGATLLAVVDLTQMLNTTTVPRTAGGHACASGTLPASVVTLLTLP